MSSMAYSSALFISVSIGSLILATSLYVSVMIIKPMPLVCLVLSHQSRFVCG